MFYHLSYLAIILSYWYGKLNDKFFENFVKFYDGGPQIIVLAMVQISYIMWHVLSVTILLSFMYNIDQ